MRTRMGWIPQSSGERISSSTWPPSAPWAASSPARIACCACWTGSWSSRASAAWTPSPARVWSSSWPRAGASTRGATTTCWEWCADCSTGSSASRRYRYRRCKYGHGGRRRGACRSCSSPPPSSSCWHKPRCYQTTLAACMRGPTYETIFALLAGLGLRIGEVSRLQCGDVDLERDVLQIRDSKFGKSRLVPFGPRLAARVRAYLELRERNGWPCSGSAPLFSWNGTSPISTNTIRNTFREDLLPRLALDVPAGTSGPTRARVAPHLRCTHPAALVPGRRGASRAAQSPLDIPRARQPDQHRGLPDHHERAVSQEANRRFEGFAPTPVEVQS